MKAVKNCIKTLTLILGLGMLFCAPISRASNVTYQQVEMGVYCYSANSGAAIADSQFELYAADNIRDVDGNIVLGKDTLLKTSTTDSSGCASFAMTLPVGRYYAKQTSVNSSYVMQDFKIYFYVTEGVSSYRENLYLPTNTSNLDLRASVPAEVVANGEYNITVGAIGNLSETNANNMVYTQNMSYNTRMVGLSTGLYNADATIGVTIINQNLQQMESNPGTEVVTGTGAGSGLSDATIRTGDETPLGKYTLFIVLGSMAALISGYILVITNKSKK